MRVRIMDVLFLTAIVALFYLEMCNARQQTSNHFFLRRQIQELRDAR